MKGAHEPGVGFGWEEMYVLAQAEPETKAAPSGVPDPVASVVARVCAQLKLAERFPDANGPVTPVVLQRRQNVIVRCDPFPVVARVANWTGTLRDDPRFQLRNEVSLSRWANSRHGSVPTPLTGQLSGPHESDGLTMSFWPLRMDLPHATDPGALGRSLADLHRATAGYPGKLAGPRQISDDANGVMILLASSGFISGDEAMLVANEAVEAAQDLAALMADLPPERLIALHGDAVRENTALENGRILWCDLEDTWRGPVEWDLACLSLTPGWSARQGEIAVRAYCVEAGHTLDEALFRACRRLRHAQMEAWGSVGG